MAAVMARCTRRAATAENSPLKAVLVSAALAEEGV
jgi:hypothetical protein